MASVLGPASDHEQISQAAEARIAFELASLDTSPLSPYVVGVNDRTNMSGPVYVVAFFGMMEPAFTWWGTVLITAEAFPVLGADEALPTMAAEGSQQSDDALVRALLAGARVVDNVQLKDTHGLLLRLDLGDAAFPIDGSSEPFMGNAAFAGGQSQRNALLGQCDFDTRARGYHVMSTRHRSVVFRLADVLAAMQPPRALYIVAETLPVWKLVRVTSRPAWEEYATRVGAILTEEAERDHEPDAKRARKEDAAQAGATM